MSFTALHKWLYFHQFEQKYSEDLWYKYSQPLNSQEYLNMWDCGSETDAFVTTLSQKSEKQDKKRLKQTTYNPLNGGSLPRVSFKTCSLNSGGQESAQMEPCGLIHALTHVDYDFSWVYINISFAYVCTGAVLLFLLQHIYASAAPDTLLRRKQCWGRFPGSAVGELVRHLLLQDSTSQHRASLVLA